MTNDNLHKIAIEAKFLGPTNTKGDRIKLTLPRWGNKSKTISYDYANSNTINNVRVFLNDNNIPIQSYCETSKGYVFCVDFTFVDEVLKVFGVK